ncbi:EAL domain-containing protein [Belnapia sp. T6]|uniref:EAL domain-containing protein n=1 Tax=Belnapia mucosa TaxID=2804532 RepID=A0ABS1V8T5_9PROT|nr:EAL domain-containing protein [Belnapia mucosa]MBL6457159.1 EAL domain-containing protein [Belnapia mucosa]
MTESGRQDAAVQDAEAGLDPLAGIAAAYAAAPVGLAFSDRRLRYLAINEHLAAINGYPRDATLGRTPSEVFGPKFGGMIEASQRQAMESGQPLKGLEIRTETPAHPGEERDYLASYHPVRNPAGEIVGVSVAVVDISKLKEADAAFRLLFDHNPVPMWVYDRQGLGFLEVNEAATASYGWSRETFLGMNILDIRPATEREMTLRSAAAPRTAHKISGPWRHLDAWGRERLVQVMSYRLEFAGKDAVLVGAWDVTDRIRAEEALRESEAFARSVVESSPDRIEVLDLEGNLLFMNGPGRRLMEVEDFAAIEGRPWWTGLPETVAEAAQQAVAEARLGRSSRFTGAWQGVHGTPRWWDIVVSPVHGPGGEVVRLLSIARDVTEQRAAEERIAHLALHDPLTDLANRRLFRQRLQQALAGLGQGERLALHCLDLDHFKGINDTLGHPIGDALLRQTALRLRGCLRQGDFIARIGGDEFAIIQAAPSDAETAAELAGRVAAALEEPYDIEGHHIAAGTSIGIALSGEAGQTPDDLVRNADIALYRAKADGRGTFRFFERAMDEAVQRRQALKTALRAALERGELALQFQPLVALDSDAVTCCEALMRWRHPELGPVSPAEFIPIAEETGAIIRIGEWALRTACRAATTWPASVRVAVNLSPVQFRNPGLVQAVRRALAEAGLAPGRLELEITESVLLRDDEANLAVLRELRALGVRIVLDDFGTGFSSLGYLLRFPFDKMKLDRAFVAGLPDREQSIAIVRAVLGLGRSLGIPVAAEGVETGRQLDALRGYGCEEVQGYLFSRPVPSAALDFGRAKWADAVAAG